MTIVEVERNVNDSINISQLIDLEPIPLWNTRIKVISTLLSKVPKWKLYLTNQYFIELWFFKFV